jgi:cytochrome c oxidase subunit II
MRGRKGLMARQSIGTLLLIAIATLVGGCAGFVPFGDDDSAPATGTDGEPAEVGEALYNRHCFGCHTTDGSPGVGPTFEGLYMSEVPLADGTTVVADEEYLHEAIVNPASQIREGYPNVMPPFGNLDDAEIDALIAFIQTQR